MNIECESNYDSGSIYVTYLHSEWYFMEMSMCYQEILGAYHMLPWQPYFIIQSDLGLYICENWALRVIQFGRVKIPG